MCRFILEALAFVGVLTIIIGAVVWSYIRNPDSSQG